MSAPSTAPSFIQPLIAPLYSGRTASEVLALLTGQTGASSHDILRAYWREYFRSLEQPDASNFEAWWRKAMHDGSSPARQSPRITVTSAGRLAQRRRSAAAASDTGLEIVFRPDPASSTAASPTTAGCKNCPKPITKITWDNAPTSARRRRCGSASPRRTARGRQRQGRHASTTRPTVSKARFGSCRATPTTPSPCTWATAAPGRPRRHRRRLQRLCDCELDRAVVRPRRLPCRTRATPCCWPAPSTTT